MKKPAAKRSHKKAPAKSPAKPAPPTQAQADVLAVHFVAQLHDGSNVHREQLRRAAVAAISGHRQALDALCRLRSKGLQREDLAGIGMREHCGEWSSLWRLVERRAGEIEADKREAALAGESDARPKDRTNALLAEVVKMEDLLYEREKRIKELEAGTPVSALRVQIGDLQSRVNTLADDNRALRNHLSLAQKGEAEYARQAKALRDRSPLLRLKRWLSDLHFWGTPS